MHNSGDAPPPGAVQYRGAPPPRAAAKIGGEVKVAAVCIVLLIILGTLGGSMVAVPLTPIGFGLVVFCMSRVPLRVSLMALITAGFCLENAGDAESRWQGPFVGFGTMMLSHLNTVDRSLGGLTSWMSFSGMDLCFASLLLIAWSRHKRGVKSERVDHVPTPRALVNMAWLTYVGMILTWCSGLIRGGEFRFSLWQLDRVMYLPTVFMLSHLCFRGPKDLPSLATILVASGAYKACVASYVTLTVAGDVDSVTGEMKRLACATNHGDSVLFACALVAIGAIVLERVRSKRKRLALFLLPVVIAGMIANNRRIVWVDVAIVCITVYVVARDNPVKRAIRRTLLVLSPVIVGYLMVGWESESALFKPVQLVRSVVDPQSDGSTMWREYENFNIIKTVQLHPMLGSGYGFGYVEFFPMPSIPYDLEFYSPHNSILGLLCYAGYFGFVALTALWGGGVYFGMRAYHMSTEPAFRAAALVGFGTVLIYMVQCWGDMGLGTWTGVFTVGPALAISGKLLVASGGWPVSNNRRTAWARFVG